MRTDCAARTGSESYHDDIQQNKVAKPSTRSERVHAVVDWLNRAAPDAANKLRAREEMLARMEQMGSPTQRYMREQYEKAQKEGAKEGKKGSEEVKVTRAFVALALPAALPLAITPAMDRGC